MLNLFTDTVSRIADWGVSVAVAYPLPFAIMAAIAALTCLVLTIEQLRQRDWMEVAAYGGAATAAALSAYQTYMGQSADLHMTLVGAAYFAVAGFFIWLAWAIPQTFAGVSDARQARKAV